MQQFKPRLAIRDQLLYGEHVASPIFISKGNGLLLVTPRTSLPFISPGYVDRFVSKHSRDPQGKKISWQLLEHDVFVIKSRLPFDAIDFPSFRPAIQLATGGSPGVHFLPCTAPTGCSANNNPAPSSAGTLTAEKVSR
jgi:hypothetical protein